MLSAKRKRLIKDNITYWVFLIVPALIYLIFFLCTNGYSLFLSTCKWSGLDERKFIGLRNFIEMFSLSTTFWPALKNTVIYTVTVTVLQTAIGLLVAMLVYKPSRMNNLFRTLYFLPAIFSSVAVGFIWGFIYDPNMGIINTLLGKLGLLSLQHAWLGERVIVVFAVAFVHVWVGIGYSMILFITGLQQIPGELYEAGDIEGANAWQKFRYITLPMLRPTLLIIIVVTTIGSFKAFDYVYILTGGGSAGQADVLGTLIYKEAFGYSRLGYGSALAVVLLVCIACISLIQMRLLRDKD